ncbi:MAG: hypothetical protein WBD34_22760 [Burkholderiaceae bacterium]
MTIEQTTPIDRDADRLAELMPWYHNNTLSAQDRVWVESQLASDPQAGAMLAFDQRIDAALQSRAAEVPADLGWEKLIQRVRIDAAPASSSTQQYSTSGSLISWLGSLLTPRVGMAMAVLLAVQTLGIGFLVNDRAGHPAPSEYRSVGGLAPHPVIRGVFADTATTEQVRDLLLEQGLTIVDGPNQLGEYQLIAAQPDLKVVAERLKSAGLLTRYAIDQRVMIRPAQ